MASIVINLVDRTRINDHKIIGRVVHDGSGWGAEGAGWEILEQIKLRQLAWGPVYLDLAKPDKVAELLPKILRSVYLTAIVEPTTPSAGSTPDI